MSYIVAAQIIFIFVGLQLSKGCLETRCVYYIVSFRDATRSSL